MPEGAAQSLVHEAPPGQAPRRPSGWGPLHYPDFRRLWSAQFVSNIGSWMQTVGAQWVMTSLTSSATLVAAISAAGSLPVLLLAVPAGVLGDLVDRKKLIAGSQLVMLGGAAAMAVIAAEDALTPAALLALLFVIGCGGAASAPTWQTLQPELVPTTARTDAIALGSVNQNLARAVGPAIGGALLAATSAAFLFGLNALSFVAVLAAVMATTVPRRRDSLPREHALDATRAGGRFVANSPALLALIARAVCFVFPAGATWALLPLVARHTLDLGSGGYGLLLACVGIGAVAAATLGPGLRRRVAPRALYALCALVVGGTAVVLAVATTAAIDAVVLVVAGAAWIVCLGLLGSAYQATMPAWVKARGMAYYLVAFQGSIAIGGLAYGAIAQAASLDTALLALAATLAAGVAATWLLALPEPGAIRTDPGEPWALPVLPPDADRTGPVMVTVRWPVREDEIPAFLARARVLRHSRSRTGAINWRLYRDIAAPRDFVETFVVGTWDEHERQHGRVAAADTALLDGLEALLRPGESRTVEHSLAVHTNRHGGA